MADLLNCAKAPCKSCPYRKDVPSGIWAATEYAKLPPYDGSVGQQLMQGAAGLFMCHQQDGCLCAGWVGTHGAHNLAAMRIARQVSSAVYDYESPVPLFSSGAAAAAHGLREIETPSLKAKRTMGRLLRARDRRA